MKGFPLPWMMAGSRLLEATASLLGEDKGKGVVVRVLFMLAFVRHGFSQHLRPFEVGAW